MTGTQKLKNNNKMGESLSKPLMSVEKSINTLFFLTL